MVEHRTHDDSPQWEEIRSTPSAAMRWLGTGGQPWRTLRARYGAAHLPVVAIRAGSGTFKGEITQDTAVRVGVDVVTAFPIPTPFAYVMPVVFDDPEDPYWALEFLSLFRTRGDDALPEEVRRVRAELTRDLIRTFCAAKRCGLVIVDETGAVLKDELLGFDGAEEARLDQVGGVLELLDRADQARDAGEVQAAVEIFQGTFSRPFCGPEGTLYRLPPGRSPKAAAATVFPMMVDHGRLISANAVRGRQEEAPDIDVFVSHAHADEPAATALVEWIDRLWPALRVFRTDPDSERTFQSDPGYFLSSARRARALVYLATRNSLDRLMVDTEIGTCADKPIVSLAVGDVTIADLEAKSDDSLFLVLPREWMIAADSPGAWHSFADALGRILGLTVPGSVPPLALPTSALAARDTGIEAHVQDWMSIASSGYGVRSEDEAQRLLVERLVEEVRAAEPGLDIDRLRSHLLGLPPQANLLTLLAARPEEQWTPILDVFPVLLDDTLLALAPHILGDAGRGEADPRRAETDRRRIAIVGQVTVAAAIESRPSWPIVRGEAFLRDIGFHPRALEYFDHTCVERRPPGTFDFGFQDPRGEPPIDAIRAAVAESDSAREWFIDRLTHRLRRAARESGRSRAVYTVTDFHTGKLAELRGFDWLEEKESDPTRGMRGLLRYLQPCYGTVLGWELEACRRAAAEIDRLYVVFPLARSPLEIEAGLGLAEKASLQPAGFGLVPEAPASVIGIDDFIEIAAPALAASEREMVLLIDLVALANGMGLGGSASSPGEQRMLLGTVVTLVDQARRAGARCGVVLSIGITVEDLETLCTADPRVALKLAKELTFLVRSSPE